MSNIQPSNEYEICEEHISKPITSDIVGGKTPPSFDEIIERAFVGKSYKL